MTIALGYWIMLLFLDLRIIPPTITSEATMIVSRLSRMGSAVGKRKRNDVAVKVDAELVRIARVIAAYRKISLAEYLSERLRPMIDADHAEEMEKNMPALPGTDSKAVEPRRKK